MATPSITKLKQLAIEHDYYCRNRNFYSNEPNQEWNNWDDFYQEWKCADIDMNLVFRWDIKEYEGRPGKYKMEIFIISQRKGIFVPISISSIEEKDVAEILEFLTPSWKKLKKIWKPL